MTPPKIILVSKRSMQLRTNAGKPTGRDVAPRNKEYYVFSMVMAMGKSEVNGSG